MSQLLRTLCNAEELRKEVDTMRRIFLQNVSDEAEQELVTEQIDSQGRGKKKCFLGLFPKPVDLPPPPRYI